MAVARDARILRSTLTRRLKGETPGFYFYELEEICRVLEVKMPDIKTDFAICRGDRSAPAFRCGRVWERNWRPRSE